MSNWGSSKKRTSSSARPPKPKAGKPAAGQTGSGKSGSSKTGSSKAIVGSRARRHTARSAGLAPDAGERRDARGGRRAGARVPRTRADRRGGPARPRHVLRPRRSPGTRRGDPVRVARRARPLCGTGGARGDRRVADPSRANLEPGPARCRLGDGGRGLARPAARVAWARRTHRRRRSARTRRRLARGARGRAPEGARRFGRRHGGPPRRPRRRRAAHHPDLDADHGVTHRWLPRHDRDAGGTMGEIRPEQHLHAEQRSSGGHHRRQPRRQGGGHVVRLRPGRRPRRARRAPETVARAQAQGVGRESARCGVARRRPGRRMGPAADDVPRPAGRTDHRPQGGRVARAHAAGVARLARRRNDARRDDRRPDRHPVRTRARSRSEGRPGHEPAEGHRLRDGGDGRAHPGADPRPLGDRGGGAEPATSAGRAR